MLRILNIQSSINFFLNFRNFIYYINTYIITYTQLYKIVLLLKHIQKYDCNLIMFIVAYRLIVPITVFEISLLI